MNYQLQIKRQKEKDSISYWQTINYTCEEDEQETVATVLTSLANGSDPIAWECSCLQKKCGSCAMVIDGRPQLACNFFLKNHRGKRPIVIEPLRKFPVVRDLIVDRSIMRENLKKIQAWMASEAIVPSEKQRERMYDASRCLQCGCCLEVCPNFCAGDDFLGTAGAVPVSRILQAGENESIKDQKKSYKEHFYKGCGKSLACRDICPAKIDIDQTLSSTNALAVWKS
jgi:succinate dehydrogenase / fumarate reductase iron-sulfur subunit